MNDEHDDETIRIAYGVDHIVQFFEGFIDDPSIREQIPKGSTIEIFARRPDEQDAQRAAEAAKRALNTIEIGDLMVYILEIPAHAAN